MTAPPFIFNHRTGELQRGGRAITLCKLHSEMFAYLALASEDSPIGPGSIARSTGMKLDDVPGEMRYLAKRLQLVSIRVGSSPRGRWLIFEEIPKWQPNIAPPVRLEGEVP
jgi:hypothetical protein